MIHTYLQQFTFLSDNEIQNFIDRCTPKTWDKGAFFIREGEIAREVLFIKSGIFRSYYPSDKGDEMTYCITFPNRLMTAYSSFISQNGTPENIQAITPVQGLAISKEEIEQLATENINWLKVLKIIAEQEYIELEKRVFQLQRDSAAKRYEDLLISHPEYIREIPLQYLASYLGITQRHLSRLRKQVQN